MLDYQHQRHAGNFADVHKHLVLWSVLEALRGRDKPFVAIDLYAGSGRYDLARGIARKTGEWEQGIGQLWRDRHDVETRSALGGYLADIVALQPDADRLQVYPGSPLLMQAGLRGQDSLIACERQPETYAALKQALQGDARCHAHQRDAREAAQALFPPQPRRGFVLLDPPYKRRDEYAEVVRMTRTIRERWNTGTILIWYPVLSGRPDHALREALTGGLGDPWLVNELRIARDPARHTGLAGSGVLILRPPWQLEERLIESLKVVHATLDPDGLGGLYRAEGLENAAGDPSLRPVKPI